MNKIAKKRLVRADSISVEFYNDGLTVFLYDAAHENLIRETDPPIIWFAGAESLSDAATKALTESGALLVYGLHGDNCINIEIAVSDRLSSAESAGAEWFEPQKGFLNLPSGRLCVHSYNTLPMGDNGDEPPDEGAALEVGPGFYEVTLYRIDWSKTEARGIGYDAEKADEVIVLTPAATFSAQPNILFRECLE